MKGGEILDSGDDVLRRIFSHNEPGSVYSFGPGMKASAFHWEAREKGLTFEGYLRRLSTETLDTMQKTRSFFSSIYFWGRTELFSVTMMDCSNPLNRGLQIMRLLGVMDGLKTFSGVAATLIGGNALIEIGKGTKPLLDVEILGRTALVTAGISRDQMILVSVGFKRDKGREMTEIFDTEVTRLDSKSGLESSLRPLPEWAKHMSKLGSWEGQSDERVAEPRRFSQ